MKVPNLFRTMHCKQVFGNVSTHLCWLMLFVLLFASMGTRAEDSIPAVNPDTITDENFVTASLLVASPGKLLYSVTGHAALRMQCPTHNLDYVFSYESEEISNKVLTFLSGRLMMGLFAVETPEYLSFYRDEGRGVKEYTLQLPIKVKQNLWRVLDDHVAEGPYLHYDYIKYGCSHSALMMIKEGLDTIPLEYGVWPEKYQNLTRREITGLHMSESPWSWFFLNILCNGSINDEHCFYEDKVIIPSDLIEVLQNSKVSGKQVLSQSPNVLLPQLVTYGKPVVTPTMVAIALLILTMVAYWFRSSIMDYMLLAIQTTIGLLTVYLVFFSSLCCTEWSWQIVPFNPLPLVFWKWRHQWCIPYALVIGLWALAMVVYPHSLTENTLMILSVALIISYLHIHKIKNNKEIYETSII